MRRRRCAKPHPRFRREGEAEFAAAAGGSSLADALLVCLVYSAAIAALCFGAATAWALRQPTGSDRHAAVLTGAAAVSILLFWVVLSATLPEALRPLAFRNGMSVRADPDFHRDPDRLDEQLRQLASAGRR